VTRGRKREPKINCAEPEGYKAAQKKVRCLDEGKKSLEVCISTDPLGKHSLTRPPGYNFNKKSCFM